MIRYDGVAVFVIIFPLSSSCSDADAYWPGTYLLVFTLSLGPYVPSSNRINTFVFKSLCDQAVESPILSL